ncbi:MAG: hypothetical protein L6Q54_09880 [Leptospiraceae bacterium]|nr:hypothetical protein [Leptospiraceae bacterium]MCK6381535.1 hypothetical protein [Leptospiraceae bacterium]
MIPTYWLLSPLINSDTITGWGVDPYFCTFVMDKVSGQFALGLSPFQSKFWDIGLFYPAIRTLAYSDPFILQGFLVFLLKTIFSVNLFTSANIVFALFFLLNFFCAFLLFYEISKNKNASIISSWLWAFSLHHLSQSSHFQNTSSFTIPLALYFTFKIFSNSKFIYKLGLALSFFLLACSNLYYFVFTEIAVGFTILFQLIFTKTFQMRKTILLRSTFSIMLAVLFSLPILYRYFESAKIYPEIENSRGSIADQMDFSARASDYFSSLHDPIEYKKILPTVTNIERIVSPGLYTFGISIIFILFQIFNRIFIKKYPSQIFYYGVGLLIFSSTIASGLLIDEENTTLLFQFIPGILNLRAIGRVGILIVLAECILIAILL